MAGGLTNPAEHWESVARNNFKRIEQLEEALKESVKLQSHYAKLLNMHDGGERIEFLTADDWVNRLRSLKEEKEKENCSKGDRYNKEEFEKWLEGKGYGIN